MTTTFFVSEKGLQTHIDEWLTSEQYYARRNQDFEPNCNWYSITVKSASDIQKWIRLRNEQLECLWTPNQDRHDREYNKARLDELSGMMTELEK